MTVVIAILKARPEHAEEVERGLLALRRHAGDEPGALEYAVHRQDDTGFLVYERYADQAACDAHFAAPYVIEFLDSCTGWLVDAPRVEFGRVVARFDRD